MPIIVVRKLFHFIASAVFVTGLLGDVTLLHVSCTAALTIFILIEVYCTSCFVHSHNIRRLEFVENLLNLCLNNGIGLALFSNFLTLVLSSACMTIPQARESLGTRLELGDSLCPVAYIYETPHIIE